MLDALVHRLTVPGKIRENVQLKTKMSAHFASVIKNTCRVVNNEKMLRNQYCPNGKCPIVFIKPGQ